MRRAVQSLGPGFTFIWPKGVFDDSSSHVGRTATLGKMGPFECQVTFVPLPDERLGRWGTGHTYTWQYKWVFKALQLAKALPDSST
jgi:hypothetical protein